MDNNNKTRQKNTIVFLLNGKKKEVGHPEPGMMLAYYLRGLGLTGTRIGCGEGGCGSCTVMLSRYNKTSRAVEHLAIKSCLTPLCSIDGTAITTVEGIGNIRDGLDPVQYRIAAHNGSQCGFCTPGFVMNMYTFRQNNNAPTAAEIEDLFDGNLCRCTGYRAILHGMKTFVADYKPDAGETPHYPIDPAYKVLEKSGETQMDYKPLKQLKVQPSLTFEANGSKWFRPATLTEVYTLKNRYSSEEHFHRTMLVVGHTSTGVCNNNPAIFIDISRIEELTVITEEKDKNGNKGIRVGAAIPIQHLIDTLKAKSKNLSSDQAVGISALCDLACQIASLQIRNTGSIGGNIYLAKLFEQYYPFVIDWHHDKHTTFVSDLFTAFAVLGVTVTVGFPSAGGKKVKPAVYQMLKIPNLDKTPTPGQLSIDAVFLDFFIPYSIPGDFVRTYKVADREQDGQAFVNAGFRVRFGKDKRVEEAVLIFGGIGYNSVSAGDTGTFLKGKAWNGETLAETLTKLMQELTSLARDRSKNEDNREYRVKLARDLFYRFYLDIADKVAPGSVKAPYFSGATPLKRKISFGIQDFITDKKEYPVNEPMIKNTAFIQASGEAKYTHDLLLPANGLHAVMVSSTSAASTFSFKYGDMEIETPDDPLAGLIALLEDKFKSIGFVDFVTFADVPGKDLNERLRRNRIGLGKDDPVFAPYVPDGTPGAEEADKFFSNNIVTCVGAPIGLVLAENQYAAMVVAGFIENACIQYDQIRYDIYNYERLSVPVIYSLEEGMDKPDRAPYIFVQNPETTKIDKPMLNHIPSITRPGSDPDWIKDPAANLIAGSHEIKGTQKCGGQAHFYLETQSALVIPHENNYLTIYVSTQNPAGNQSAAHRILGIDANHIEVIVKRIGGGFGGKQSRSAFISSAAAVAAWKHNRPVKLELFRNTDTTMVGKRHPFIGQYWVAYTPEGQIKGWKTIFNADGGNTYDQSFPIMDLAQLHGDNVYNTPTYHTEGYVYRTNRASNTAFRSFGTVQSILAQENAIEHMAHELKMLPEDIREKNLYQTGSIDSCDSTPYGQDLIFCNIKEIWDELMQSSDFVDREKKVRDFNKKNLWKKRGISMIPLKYGISYTGPRGTLNQGYALVNIYASDGTVLVMCGGVEMGQGLNTKMAQIAAQTLGIPIKKVRVGSTDSNAVPNATATAASTGADLNGGAVEKACKELRRRLEKYCEKLEQCHPRLAIKDWRTDWQNQWSLIIVKAYTHRVNLSAQAHYKTRHYSPVDTHHPQGHPFFYFTYSAAVSEVEVDVLTGQFTVLRSDILYDAGNSLNPLIDVGQIEGGFVQGIGYLTCENLVYTPAGVLVTNRTWNYKPPYSKNIPVDFRVTLKPYQPKPGGQISRDAPKCFEEKPFSNGAVKKSKGIGEPPFVLAVSVFFAIKHAVMDARKDQGAKGGQWLEMAAPATVQRIKESCEVNPGKMKESFK